MVACRLFLGNPTPLWTIRSWMICGNKITSWLRSILTRNHES